MKPKVNIDNSKFFVRYLCPPGTRYDPRVHNCNHDFLAPPCHLSSDPGKSFSNSKVS